jgi:hypothetical protein
MQRMQKLSSLRWCDQVTQPKAPLDSAAIYPITRSLNNHLETGKRKTYKGHTFALGIPLDLDDGASCFIQVGMPTWSLLLREDSWLLPHTPLWESSIEAHLHKSIITKWKTRFKHDLIDIQILNLPFTILMTSKLDGILSWAIWDHNLDACPWKQPNPHRKHKCTCTVG